MKTTRGNSPKTTRYDSRALFLSNSRSDPLLSKRLHRIQFGITSMAGVVMVRWPLAHPDTPGGVRLLWLQRLQRCTGVQVFWLTL